MIFVNDVCATQLVQNKILVEGEWCVFVYVSIRERRERKKDSEQIYSSLPTKHRRKNLQDLTLHIVSHLQVIITLSYVNVNITLGWWNKEKSDGEQTVVS